MTRGVITVTKDAGVPREFCKALRGAGYRVTTRYEEQ